MKLTCFSFLAAPLLSAIIFSAVSVTMRAQTKSPADTTLTLKGRHLFSLQNFARPKRSRDPSLPAKKRSRSEKLLARNLSRHSKAFFPA